MKNLYIQAGTHLQTKPCIYGSQTVYEWLTGSLAARHKAKFVGLLHKHKGMFVCRSVIIDLKVNRPLITHLSLHTRLNPTRDKKIGIMGLVYNINQ